MSSLEIRVTLVSSVFFKEKNKDRNQAVITAFIAQEITCI